MADRYLIFFANVVIKFLFSKYSDEIVKKRRQKRRAESGEKFQTVAREDRGLFGAF